MRAIPLTAAIAAVLLLAGCAEQPVDDSPDVSAPAPTPTQTAEAPAVQLDFAQPTQCSGVLPASRITDLESRPLVLLGGPEGRYGNEYALEPSAEEDAGGIRCIWGDSVTEASSVTVSVAPLSPATRATIVQNLLAQGLNESIDGDTAIYWQEGDTELEPAIINVIRTDSWISVIETIGGPAAYDEAHTITAEAYTSVYS